MIFPDKNVVQNSYSNSQQIQMSALTSEPPVLSILGLRITYRKSRVIDGKNQTVSYRLPSSFKIFLWTRLAQSKFRPEVACSADFLFHSLTHSVSFYSSSLSILPPPSLSLSLTLSLFLPLSSRVIIETVNQSATRLWFLSNDKYRRQR